MTGNNLPQQLDPSSSLIRSWSVDHPRFYGVKTTSHFVEALLETESKLALGIQANIDPQVYRVLASYHGPKGAKVPLSTSTISGCVRPAFVANNEWLSPGAMACYGGGCYLFHARAIPAKQAHEHKVRAHMTPADGLIAAAQLSRHYGIPIRDNQSSDGSLSISLPVKNNNETQLQSNLLVLEESGFADVNYLCFSSAYIKVPDYRLRELARYKNLVVHLTTSGWHSKNENLLRLYEFERYKSCIQNVMLRVVNRQDWVGDSSCECDGAAQCEEWLLNEIERRGLSPYVIRTPYHSVHPFPGSRTGSLGSRHMAFTDYYDGWGRVLDQSVGECCTTGKCKTCPTRCGADIQHNSKPKNLIISARALEGMYWFELGRQSKDGISPLAVYTARMLARKSMEQYAEAGESRQASLMKYEHQKWYETCKNTNLTTLQRRRLANDSHALIVDGMDRHGLWKNVAKGDAK